MRLNASVGRIVDGGRTAVEMCDEAEKHAVGGDNVHNSSDTTSGDQPNLFFAHALKTPAILTFRTADSLVRLGLFKSTNDPKSRFIQKVGRRLRNEMPLNTVECVAWQCLPKCIFCSAFVSAPTSVVSLTIFRLIRQDSNVTRYRDDSYRIWQNRP